MGSKRPTRIQLENRETILGAALDVFAQDGFHGATLDAIASGAGMSKPNVLYYFASKEEMYRTLLTGLLDSWLEPLRALRADGDPAREIAAYIERKIELARDYPRESRLFAGEMLRGAPILEDVLAGEMKALVDEKAATVRGWMAEGRLAPVDPHHLIFAIWATTQHYADFDAQVRSVLGDETAKAGEGRFHDAAEALTKLMLQGLLPR